MLFVLDIKDICISQHTGLKLFVIYRQYSVMVDILELYPLSPLERL